MLYINIFSFLFEAMNTVQRFYFWFYFINSSGA